MNQQQTNFPDKLPGKDAKKKCFFCDKVGHISKECYSRQNKVGRSKSSSPRNFGNEQNKSFFSQFRNRVGSDETGRNNSNSNTNRYNGNSYNNNNTNNNGTNRNTSRSFTPVNNNYRTNWNRSGNSQTPSTSTGSNNNNNNRSEQTRNTRIIRFEGEDTVDWDEILPSGNAEQNEGN